MGKKESLNEYMDEELPVLPFSAYNLKDIAVLTGLDNAEKTINSEFGVDFCNIIAKLCFEIASLYGFLGEHVNTIQETSELQSFLFDLSAFLGELECPHESITCGPLEDRFLSRTRRSFLFNYLISEIRTARLYAAQQLQNNEKNIYASSVPVAVSSALYTLNASHGTGNLIGAVDALKHETEKALQSLSNPPKPLFQPHSMKEDTWKDIEKVARSLAQDCRSRHLILLKRMDVTINSFLWSDRVRKQENKIRKLYMEQREKLAEVSVPGIPDLVSASDLLRIEPASSSKRRLHTRSKVKPTALEGTPTDRGGRTDDLHGFKNESFSKQYHNRGNRGRDRHHRNQEHGNGQNVSQEQKVREEYTGRNRGGQGEHRGRGGRNRRN